jgi:hypothetical protein
VTTDAQLLVDLERNRPFVRLTVEAHVNVAATKRVLVMWAMNPTFRRPLPWTFVLYRGYAVNDDNYVAVSTTTDQPWLYDNKPVFPAKGSDVFYKVRLTTGDGEVFDSQAAQLGTDWGRYDWGIAKEILRKETLLLVKKVGTKGWLLKRRLWGSMCPVPGCTDPETGQVNDPNCPVCYGTGIEGGYYAPLDFWVTMNPTQRMKKLDNNLGVVAANIETVRALAYPATDAGDVWIQASSDQRFVVQSDVVSLVRHRGIDLVMNLRLEELPRSDIVYSVPTPCLP